MSQAETQLIRQVQTGDSNAFDRLYKTHQPRIYNTVLSRAHPNDVDDLVQITFMRAFESIQDFRGTAAFATWLTRIALNVCNTQWRTRSRQQSRHTSLDTTDQPLDIHTDTPETQLQRAEYRTLVMQNIQKLPEKHRKAVWLHYVMDRSYEEITHTLCVPVGTVKTWLNRGRRELRDSLQRQGVYDYELA